MSSEQATRRDLWIERHFPALLRFVRANSPRAVLLRESSSDVAQTVVRELLADADFELRDELAFRAWLFTTARRKLRDRMKYYLADKRHPAREQRLIAGVAEPAEVELLSAAYRHLLTPSRVAAGVEELQRFERALGELRPADREVVTLVRLAELPFADVAGVLGIEVEAARKRFYRALARLSQAMEPGGPSAPEERSRALD